MNTNTAYFCPYDTTLRIVKDSQKQKLLNKDGSQLKASDIPENTDAFFACSAGEKAFEHRDWGHGAFTKFLLEKMDALASVGPERMPGVSPRAVTRHPRDFINCVIANALAVYDVWRLGLTATFPNRRL